MNVIVGGIFLIAALYALVFLIASRGKLFGNQWMKGPPAMPFVDTRLRWPVIPSVTNELKQVQLHHALKYKRVELECNRTKKVLGSAVLDGEFYNFEKPIPVKKGEQYTLWFYE